MNRPGKPRGQHYLSHQTVDTDNGIVIGLNVTSGDVYDSVPYLEQIEHIHKNVIHIQAATADSAYDFPLAHRVLEVYSASDKDLACDGIGLETIRTIGGNNRGVVPVIINNRTMIPIAALVEGMGGSAEWDGSKRLVTVNLWDSTMMQHNTLKIPIGSNTVYLNNQGVTFDTAARIERSRTLVPIRLLELLGCDIEWVSESKSVVICYQGSGNVG